MAITSTQSRKKRPPHAFVDLAWARVDRLSAKARLSKREHEVLDHLLFGRKADEISERIGIAPRTVKFHQANLLRKLGLGSRIELTRLFVV